MIPVSARNIQFVGHTDQNGRGDGVQVMVHKGHAFVGHMFSDGFTVRVFDITDPFSPREVAHFVPPAPEKMVDPRPNRPRVIQSNDVYVAPDGLMYVTDVNDGLTILQYRG